MLSIVSRGGSVVVQVYYYYTDRIATFDVLIGQSPQHITVSVAQRVVIALIYT